MGIISRALKTDIKEISMGRIYRAITRRILNVPHAVQWFLPSKFSKENKKKLLTYKNKHKGKRCFIIANGPSLQNMDLSLLKNEVTIGMNRIYLLREINGFSLTYLVVSDIPIQLRQFTKEYNSLDIPKFFNWNARNLFDKKENLCFFRQKFKMCFSPNFLYGIGASKSVTYFCIQLAYFMGFKEVILIGKDHYFSTKGPPGKKVISTGTEENHFIKGYYKKGQVWRIPNYTDEDYSYMLAKETFEKDGRKILDATVEGKLNVFEKVNYYDLFK